MHTPDRVPTVGDGILGAGMDTIPVGPHSVTRKELVDPTRTGHVMGMVLFPVSIVIYVILAETEESAFTDYW